MVFERQTPATEVDIGDIQIVLDDPKPDAVTSSPAMPGRPQSATAVIQVIMSDGSIQIRRANLPNFYPATVINQLKNLAQSVRTKARQGILGETE